jgi:putative PIN family toxin of toxin-antitoxin system
VIRVVRDANVLVAAIAAHQRSESPPARILEAWLDGAFELFVSEPLIAEVVRALRKPYFTDRIQPAFFSATVGRLQDLAMQVEISIFVEGAATHPEDDLTLATAVSAAADILVTGDRQLRKLGSFQGVIILSPAEFIDFLDQQSARQSDSECPTT